MKFADPEIESILRTYLLDEIHHSDDPAYALRPDLTLAYVNLGWSKFALANGGSGILDRWPLGSSIQDSIPGTLRPFFIGNFSKCLTSGSPWQHRYECSSPGEYREYLMTAYPLGDQQGLLIVNSLAYKAQHGRTAHSALEEYYRDDYGLITQCVHCRRIKRLGAEAVWDCVPDWIRSCPQNTSHGLCEPCYGYFYPSGTPMLGGYPKIFHTAQ